MTQTRMSAPFLGNNTGVLWFDGVSGKGPRDPDCGGGIASIAGAETFRFAKPEDLPRGVVWWTNLTKVEQWKFGKLRFFKEQTFFGVSWYDLDAVSNESPADIKKVFIEKWSLIFYKITDWCSWFSKKNNLPPFSWGDGNALDVFKMLFFQKDEIGSADIYEISKSAFIEEIAIPLDSHLDSNKKILSLFLPESDLFLSMFTQPFPIAEWESVDVPKNKGLAKKWLETEINPLLVKVEQLDFENDSDSSKWIKCFLGNRIGLLSTGSAETFWCTGEEAKEIAAQCEISISAAYLSKGWTSMSTPEVGFEKNEMLAKVSSVEKLWYQACIGSGIKTTRHPSSRRKTIWDERVMWWSASMRLKSFRAAFQLSEMGFTVASYGAGTVRIVAPEKERYDLLVYGILSSGLLLPPGLAKKITPDWDALGVEHSNVSYWDWLVHRFSVEEQKALSHIILPQSDKGATELLKQAAQTLLAFENNKVGISDVAWKETLNKIVRKSVAWVKQRREEE